MAADLHLRPIGPDQRRCKICGDAAPVFGAVDFNRSADEFGGPKLSPLGIPVNYRRCVGCGFLFTECFDDWTQAQFKQFIYNDDYLTVDPDYLERRPARNAVMLMNRFGVDRSRIRILDYGGGNGLLAQRLRDVGFTEVKTYDPFTLEHSARPDTRFDLITSFETFEHLPDPLAAVDGMVDLLVPGGAVLFSTLLQPPEFETIGLTWWYVGPRNGHVSLFTERSLAIAWRRHGFSVSSFSANLHLAFPNVT